MAGTGGLYVDMQHVMAAWAGLYAEFVDAANARTFRATDEPAPSQSEVAPPVPLTGAGGTIDIVA